MLLEAVQRAQRYKLQRIEKEKIEQQSRCDIEVGEGNGLSQTAKLISLGYRYTGPIKWQKLLLLLGNLPIDAGCEAAAIVDVAVVVADGAVVVPIDPCSVDADGCDVPVTDKQFPKSNEQILRKWRYILISVSLLRLSGVNCIEIFISS